MAAATSAAWTLCLLVLLSGGGSGGGGVAAQQLTPFQGRNTPPEGGLDVYISPVVDHLISVNDVEYKFQAVLYIVLTWTDERAAAAIVSSTQSALYNSSYNNGAGCTYPCTTIYAWNTNPDGDNLCCDEVYLPHFEFVNVAGFSQDRVVRYAVRAGANGKVAWWQHVQGEFYAPMSFNAFPFDTQYLSVQMQYGNKFPNSPVRIVPSATGTQLYSPSAGDELSGWKLKGVQMKTFNLTEQNLVKAGGSTLSAPGDPWPINPADPSVQAFQGVLWQTGVEIFIVVDRISLYYCITAILPIWLNTCLSLLVFSVNPRHLDTRLGIVVTLFLSLTALQFVLAVGLPSSTTIVPTQQLIIVAYCILGGIGVSSILGFWLVQLHRTSERRRRLQHAKRQFTRRWATVTTGMGLEAAAAPQMQQQRQMSVNGNGSASASSSVAGMKRRRPNAKAAPSQVAFAASPASASEQPAAAADGAAPPGLPIDAQQQQQQQYAQQPSNWPVAAGPSLAPHTGGMGVYAASSASDGGADSEDGSVHSFDSQRPGHGGMRVSEEPAPVAVADEEDGGAVQQLPKWLTRPGACCGWPRWRRRGGGGGGDAAGGGGTPHKPSWFELQYYKMKLMKEEMRRNQDYAMFVALQIDNCIFWVTLIGFNIAVVLIFAIQSQMDAKPFIP